MGKKRNETKSAVRRTAGCALLAALAAALLLAGGLFELFDMTSAAVASAAVVAAYAEYGWKGAASVYGVSALLSFILFPSASSVIYYALLLGYFPIFKLWLDGKMPGKKRRMLRMLLKCVVFNVGCALILLLFVRLYGLEAAMAELSFAGLSPKAVTALLFVLLNVFLWMYDRLIAVVWILYIRVFRKRLPGGKP